MNTVMFITGLIVPSVVLIIGVIGRIKPKKEINSLIGYRSKRSRSSQELWDRAQLLMAKYMIIIGAVLLVLSATAGVYISTRGDMNSMILGISVLSCVQVAAVILIIPLVEKGLS